MVLIAAHLNAGVIQILVVTVIGVASLFPHLLGSRSPQYLVGNNSASNPKLGFL